MFYYLFNYLDRVFDFPGAGMFNYISFRATLAFLIALVFSTLIGKRIIAKLQECLADKDAVIIMESGHEKLRYVTGSALIITSSETKYLDITKLAVEEAGKMLGKDFTTRVDY